MGSLYQIAVSDHERKAAQHVTNTALAHASAPFCAPILRDPVQRLEVIGAGDSAWRNRFSREFGRRFGLVACHELANDWFYEFCQAHVAEFGLSHNPSQVLDAIAPIRPPTEKEIRDAWTITHTLDNEQVRAQYGDYGPERALDALVGR